MSNEKKIVVVGLGYVGLPLAVEFSKKYSNVIGFDINSDKIEQYKNGIDSTHELEEGELASTNCIFTSNIEDIKGADFYVVAVPTPINTDKTPNLAPLISASKLVGSVIKKDSIVVFESTVYPGTTEEVCVPIIEDKSGLKYDVDFKIGYSPERINPGDKVNTLTKIVKVVSGSDKPTLKKVSKLYKTIIEAGVFEASSIKVAEAAKVIENSQRDINIAFMNELSMVFNMMEIDTNEVLKAASTKWNFLNFKPGLVGGHCIGVDPYYFTYKAEQLGYHSQIILAGRKINDGMAKHVATNTIKEIIKADKLVKGSKVAIFGFTFKEDCPDVRNTKVIDIYKELIEYGVEVLFCDPVADISDASMQYDIEVLPENDITEVDCVILAVPHKQFLTDDFFNTLGNIYNDKKKVLIDIKGVYADRVKNNQEYHYWSL